MKTPFCTRTRFGFLINWSKDARPPLRPASDLIRAHLSKSEYI